MLFYFLPNMPAATSISSGVYLASLLTALGISAVYNIWPVSPTKWFLRRFDHSAIYLLIAGTYTPFAMHMGIALCRCFSSSGAWLLSVSC